MNKLKGTLMLLAAAFIWGTAFVAQTSASGSVASFTFNCMRSLVAVIFLLLFIGAKSAVAKEKKNKAGSEEKRKLLLGGAACGAVLFVASNLQQFGIEIYPEGVAASGRAGFITATYVVMVALCSTFSGKKLHPLVVAAVFGCIAGMYLLCLSNGFSGIYLGDVMVFLCAICFTAYIMVVDRFSYLDSLKMSCIQFAVCAILSMIGMFIFDKPDFSVVLKAWLPICYAGVLSSGVAYTLQMAGQKYAEPAVASIVMSLESVFAALAGWAVLNEMLSTREFFGCVLVFAAVILAQVPEFIKAENT